MEMISRSEMIKLNEVLIKLNDARLELSDAENLYNKNYKDLIDLKRDYKGYKKYFKNMQNLPFVFGDKETINKAYKNRIHMLKESCKENKIDVIEKNETVVNLQQKYDKMYSSFMQEFRENGYILN